MFKFVTAGLVAAAMLAAPVLGSVANAAPTTATVVKVKSTKFVTHKSARIHRNHARILRHARPHVVASHVRHTRLHNAKRVHRSAIHRPANARHAHVVVRKHPRHTVKTVTSVKTVKQIRQAKPGRAG